MQRERKRLGIPPRNSAILSHAKDLPGVRTGGSLRPGPLQMLLVTGILAFLGVTFVILSHDIHLAPDRLAFRKDAAALESLETQSSRDYSRIESRILPLVTATSAGLDRVNARPEEILQSAPPRARLIAGPVSAVDRKRSTDSGAARKQLRAFKRDLEVRPDNIRTEQRAVSPPRQRYEQRGQGSLFTGIGHALGFSRN
jgi:hypothetical protein